MSKAQLEAAQNLAKITGRPFSDFYKMSAKDHTKKVERLDLCSCGQPWNEYGVCNGTHEESKQRKNKRVEKTGSSIQKKVDVNPREIQNKEKKQNRPYESNLDIGELLKQYGGKLINGHIVGGRQMTRKEFLAAKKTLKTKDDFYRGPYLYLLFRAEGQLNPSFIEFCNNIEKEIEKCQNKK